MQQQMNTQYMHTSTGIELLQKSVRLKRSVSSPKVAAPLFGELKTHSSKQVVSKTQVTGCLASKLTFLEL